MVRTGKNFTFEGKNAVKMSALIHDIKQTASQV